MAPDDYRKNLLAILTRLDRMATEAQSIFDAPADTELLPQAEEAREMIVEMQAQVEEKLDGLMT